MTMTPAVKPPAWFWIVAALAAVWSLLGVSAYIMDVAMSEETLAALPQAQQQVYAERPAWIVGAYAVAVFGSLAGAVALLLRKRAAVLLFAVSLAAVVVQFGYLFLAMDTIALLGAGAAIFPAVIFVIGAALIWFSRYAAKRTWLR